MSAAMIGTLGMAILVILLLLRVPVAFAMFAVGFCGVAYFSDVNSALNLMASQTFTLASSAELVVVPLFVLMGNVASATGMSGKLYDAAYAIIGSIRGGLASTTIIGCGGFAALSGSSVAAALTMGKVSLAEMERFNYDSRLSTGVVAAGGTLGILIPPSTGFVIYAIMTEQSIGRLFLAGVLPGILLLSLFIVVITVMCWLKPEMGPAGPKTNFRAKVVAFGGALPIVGIILLTIGGIYTGIFSPVEASAVGAGLAILLGFILQKLTIITLWRALKDSVVTTATLMLILIAAHMINPFLALSHIPQTFGAFLSGLDLPAVAIVCMMMFCYMVLGCFMEGFSMLILSMPIFYPVINQLGIDPIWFGVLAVLTLEMGLISPPVGVNIFIVKTVAPNVPLSNIFAGAIPFWAVMFLCLIILVVFPDISLFLPSMMIN
jgi:tripartite ATP-independent transporter DctM subunit